MAGAPAFHSGPASAREEMPSALRASELDRGLASLGLSVPGSAGPLGWLQARASRRNILGPPAHV